MNSFYTVLTFNSIAKRLLLLSFLTIIIFSSTTISLLASPPQQTTQNTTDFVRWYFDIKVGSSEIYVEETVEIWKYNSEAEENQLLISQTYTLPPCEMFGWVDVFNGEAFFDGNSYLACTTLDLYETVYDLSLQIPSPPPIISPFPLIVFPTAETDVLTLAEPFHLCQDYDGNPMPPPCNIAAEGLGVEVETQIPEYYWYQESYDNIIFGYQHVTFSQPMQWDPWLDLFEMQAEIEAGGAYPIRTTMVSEIGGLNNLVEPHHLSVIQEYKVQNSYPFRFRLDSTEVYTTDGMNEYWFTTEPVPLYIGGLPPATPMQSSGLSSTPQNFKGTFKGGRVDPTTACASCPG